MKKKLVATMFVLTMAASLIACGSSDDAEVETSEDTTTASSEDEVEAVDDSVAFWDQVSEDGQAILRENGLMLIMVDSVQSLL